MNDSNIINNTVDYKVIRAYAYAFAAPFSIIGIIINAFLLYILIKHKIFAKTTYYLLRISVISDIICNLFTAAGYLIAAGDNLSYLDGLIVCRSLNLTIVASYGVSIMTLCVIGIDRYFVIVRPLSFFYRHYKGRFIGGLLALAAIIVIGFAVPTLFFTGVYPDDTKFCEFTTITPVISYYLILCAIVMYIIPVLTLTITYGRIIIYMKNHIRPGVNITNTDAENHKKRKSIRMLMSIASAYLLISWPFFATCLGMAITRKPLRQVRQSGFIFYLLALISFSTTTTISTINPLLYLKFDSAIQSKAKMHLSAFYNTAKSRILTTDEVMSNPPTNEVAWQIRSH